MDDTIVAVRFSDVGEAHRAMRELKQLDCDGRPRPCEEARRVLREQRREERKDQWTRFKQTVQSKPA